jgi:hemerythrin
MADEKTSIEWSHALSVGIEVIDDDHKTFFEVADLMACATMETPDNVEVVIKSAITILLEYVDGHFLREERAMEAAGFPGYEEHRNLHADFKATVVQLVHDYDNIVDREEKMEAALGLAKTVYKWIIFHITTVDLEYSGYITNEHVDTRPLAFLSQEASGDFDDDGDFDLMNMIPEEDSQ